MPIKHRQIPVLPHYPRLRPVIGNITRSYPVGRQSFSRAYIGDAMVLTITSEEALPKNIAANLTTTINSNDGKKWHKLFFTQIDDHTLECNVIPNYPGLHSFRAEFSLDNGKSWFHDTVPDAWVLIDPPQVNDLLLYTLIPNISGSVTDWKEDLKRISNLGFNAVHLLPITTLDTSESPYAAHDLFDIDPSYLDKKSKLSGLAQLEEFIEEAKALNIRLCFDLVLNHVGVNSKMATQATDWIVPDPDKPDGLQRAKYWCELGWQYWEDLVLINYEHQSESIRLKIWDYMIDYALFWAKYANETGGFIRFDNLHSSDPDFVQALTTKLHAEFPNLGILAEYFADETTLLRTGPKWGLNLNLATPWDSKFVPKLREYLHYIHRVSANIRYYMPVTSHDSGTPAQEFGSVESTIPRYIAAALLGTGATGIVQGVEYGLGEKIQFIGRKEKMVFPEEPMFAPFIQKVNYILTSYSAFRRGNNCAFVDNGHDAIIAAFRQDGGANIIGFLVLCNFDTYNNQYISIDLSSELNEVGPYSCRELLSDKMESFERSYIDFKLMPSEAKIYMFLKK